VRLIKERGWPQRYSAIAGLWLVAACGLIPEPINKGADMLVVGDSILAWNRLSGQSVGDVIAQEAGLIVNNVAVSGATFLGADGITSQYVSNDWTWVLVDGGGNDLTENCLLPEAIPILDALISADGTQGAYADFADQVAADGATLLVMDYYPVSDLGGPYVQCVPAFDELTKRLARFAAQRDGVLLIETDAVIAPSNLDAYARDLVHPTPLGSALIGKQIAQVIASQ